MEIHSYGNLTLITLWPNPLKQRARATLHNIETQTTKVFKSFKNSITNNWNRIGRSYWNYLQDDDIKNRCGK